MTEEKKIELYPLCLNGKDHFTNSDGHWLPCCYLPSMGEQYEKLLFCNESWKMTDGKTDEYFFNLDEFQDWIYKQVSDPKNAFHTCKRMCNSENREAKRMEQDVQKYNFTKDTVDIKNLDLT
jgi:hypothetical protein